MLPPGSNEPTGRWRRLSPRRRRGVAAVAIVVVLALLVSSVRIAVEHGSAAETIPVTTNIGASPGPVETGSPVAGPGGSAIVVADSVPFERPTYPYVGTAPWQIQGEPGHCHVIEAYSSRPSYLPGDTLRLAVSTTGSTYGVTFWRMTGRAPDGEPFVKVGEVARTQGHRQADPTVDPVTRMVSAHWRFDFSFAIPAFWPSGVYLARLASDEGVQSYVPFVVRSPNAHAVLVVSSALNWEAYNDWGGSSVYQTHVGEPIPGVKRALGVSFDRPYRDDGGAGQIFFLELPLLQWLDRQGFDVAYTTDYDLSVAPDAQPMPRVVVFNGHDEYWGPKLYAWLDTHVNTTGDLSVAMLGADSGYWPVALRDDTPDGPRSFICLKGGPVPPALLPPGVTPEPSVSESPGPSPSEDIEERSSTGYESLSPDGPYVGSFLVQPLLGVRYQGITTSLGRYTLSATGADPRLLDGTDLTTGSSLGFIAGGEVDAVYATPEWWGPLGGRYDHVFAQATLVPGRAGRRWTAQAVWRELPSGGKVFSSGTFYWGWALDPRWGAAHEAPPGFSRLTLNILRFLGAQ